MPLFKAIVTRDVTESVEITVEAKNVEQAKDKLVSAAKDNCDLAWEKDDNDPSDVYLGDEDAVEEVIGVPGYINVEYDTSYFGGDYSGVGRVALVSRQLIETLGSVEKAFQRTAGLNPVHIVNYNLDEPVDENGDFIES